MDDEIELRVLAALDNLGADYEAIRIDPSYAVTVDFCKRYGYGMDVSANCILVASKTGERQHAACLVQATRRLDVNGCVRRRFGVRKASFAAADETIERTGMLPNGVTPFGLPADLPLWVDAGVMQHERVIVGGGSLSLKIYVASEVFARMPNAEVVDGLAKDAG
jgi:prolyl-tRNA editing enzyme YbaK/EbsC (Cys-tRNA(Pro) deacylase)